jgi:hypothetical protein
MGFKEKLREHTIRLIRYIRRNNYSGYDRYDGLESPLLKTLNIRNRKFRFYFQQMSKRLPVNIRPLLLIPKGYNPVTLGLCLQAYTNLIEIFPELADEFYPESEFLLSELERLRSPGWSGSAWGYDFDWESRYISIPAFTPTIVATGIITNALFDYYILTRNNRAGQLLESASAFLLNDLKRTYTGDTLCFSYSPLDQQIVFNASMKGVRLLAQVYHLTADKEYAGIAAQAVQFVMNHQRPDGAWVYSLNDNREWVDNYHTGYILDALKSYSILTNDNQFENQLNIGFQYYISRFFENETIPRFFDGKTYPVDSTAAAQSLITLAGFNQIETAKKVAEWIMRNMQDKDGHIYFRKYSHFTSKVSFMRWSNAWMLLGYSKLLRLI